VTISIAGGRVLGCLVEKQLTTPQQYPLSLNGLEAACNQATNRQPVMSLDQHTILQALDELKAQGLVRFVLPSHGKSVTRYRHVLDEVHGLDSQQVALMTVLLLRGPQTPGELRARTERMTEFDSVAGVQQEIEALATRPEPLVELLRRRPGQKEDRWHQLLAEEPAESGGDVDGPGDGPFREVIQERGGSLHSSDDREEATDPGDLDRRLGTLEDRVAELSDQVGSLSTSLALLRRSLGEEDPAPG
jgi:uncharacterized protein